MCGRFIVSYTYAELVSFMSSTFDIFDLDPSIEAPRYNIAPGTEVLSIINDGDNYRAGNLIWGFIPFFAKESSTGYKMINARVEGIERKVSFKDSFLHKRCLILADGYYEWKKVLNQKQPFLIKNRDDKIFFFAGLWSKYIDKDNKVIYSTTILTKEASNELVDIHDRMPIILDEDNAKLWLDKDVQEVEELFSILDTSNQQNITKKRVSEYVNSVKNSSSKCIEEYLDERLI
ncbi:Putative SOS response-associated peptidase YedK [Candidatus Izimaplasma bacterium HR1]|jgi:putative SOS response-associated peptidase YedK|uniref:SOS response-associated peptidase n=1 Tax=Candidatus Izimoplasma sp. HR1 TaxID=1541959 RepID=UPI0004F5D708|nr:Putative SOS response-associated peptidase YedK [Candidatus Izimaplasma bacterium HR1]